MFSLSLDLHMLVSNWFQQQRRRRRNMPALLNITRVSSSHLVASASVSKGLLLAALYNNVLSLRLLFLMRMMFLHVCVCVLFFIIVFISLSPFFSFLFLFYFLIVYKFSPPLPRFLIFFSISSSRFTNDFVFISICAPIGGSIIDFCLSLLHQKNLTLSLSFQQTAATAFATLKKGARGEQNEDT